jgi:hypothetical protein
MGSSLPLTFSHFWQESRADLTPFPPSMRIGLAIFPSSSDTNRAAFSAKHDHCLPRSLHSVNSLGLTPAALGLTPTAPPTALQLHSWHRISIPM